jgi:hypothetical protein
MAAVNLLDEDARIAVVNVDGDVHLIERQNRGVWAFLPEGDDDAGVAKTPGDGGEEGE